MTQQPKVSVLISFYNLAPFVDQTMESVLAQKTDFPVEILCADDGSDDGTIEKLRGWEAAHPDTVRVFVMDRVPGKKYEGNERIRRMNAIRGRLFYEAKGSYVCYLDGDDFYTDDRKLQKAAAGTFGRRAHKPSKVRGLVGTTAATTGRAPARPSRLKSPSGNVR